MTSDNYNSPHSKRLCVSFHTLSCSNSNIFPTPVHTFPHVTTYSPLSLSTPSHSFSQVFITKTICPLSSWGNFICPLYAKIDCNGYGSRIEANENLSELIMLAVSVPSNQVVECISFYVLRWKCIKGVNFGFRKVLSIVFICIIQKEYPPSLGTITLSLNTLFTHTHTHTRARARTHTLIHRIK